MHPYLLYFIHGQICMFFSHIKGPSLDCGFSTNLTNGWIGPQLSTVDGFYDNNLDCTWYVTSTGINVIDMTFIYNEIEPNNEKCELDFLEVSII